MAGQFDLVYFGFMQTIMDSSTGTDARAMSAATQPEAGNCTGASVTKGRCCQQLYELLGLNKTPPGRRCLLCPHKK